MAHGDEAIQALREAQLREIGAVASHLGIDLSESETDQIAAQLFGGTLTFRKGEIGAWRHHLSAEHIAAFKEIAGEVLVDLGYERAAGDW